MIIDSHCHLDYEPISGKIDEVLSRAQLEGVKLFLTICVKDKGFKNILSIIEKYKEVYASYGIHPHEAKNHLNIDCNYILKQINQNKKIIGIGESGLDFYYNHSDEKDQKSLFLEHIKAAQISEKPLIVHTRSAERQTLEILSSEMRNKNFKVLIHCFTGSKDFAFKLLDIGCYISASGVITFKKSLDLANTFKAIPNNRILVETDAPYLSPVPFRGKPNEPSYIIHTIKFLADIKSINLNEFCKTTSINFFNLFGKLN